MGQDRCGFWLRPSEGSLESVVVQFHKRAFPRGLKPCQFTGLIGAAEAAPFQSDCELRWNAGFNKGTGGSTEAVLTMFVITSIVRADE
jgi:hypothetical protein